MVEHSAHNLKMEGGGSNLATLFIKSIYKEFLAESLAQVSTGNPY